MEGMGLPTPAEHPKLRRHWVLLTRLQRLVWVGLVLRVPLLNQQAATILRVTNRYRVFTHPHVVLRVESILC